MKKTKILSMILCVVMVFGLVPVFASAADVADFTDVAENDWFYDNVKYVVDNGLFEGTSDTKFTPAANMTNGMVITVLGRIAGVEEGEIATAQPYYAPACVWAKENAIIEDSFDPEADVTREGLVVLLYKYAVLAGEDVSVDENTNFLSFNDFWDVSEAAKPAMMWALTRGIIKGDNKMNLFPQHTATRAEVAAIFTRTNKLLNGEAEGEMRIVCLAPDMVEVVYALGYGDCIVGWSEYTDYPVAATETEGYLPYQYYYDTYYSTAPDFDVEMELGLKDCVDLNGNVREGVRKEVATVSSFYDYNEEILVGLKPTLILCEGSAQAPWIDHFENELGITARCYDPASIKETYDMMIEIGELLGCKEYAEELVAGYYARIEEIKAITKDLAPIRTYFEIAHQSDFSEWGLGLDGPYSEGGNTPFDEMIAIAGGVNIFGDKEGYYNVYGEYGDDSFAEIAKRDPQVILSPYWPGAYDYEVTSLYEIMTRAHFNETEAVQTGRVCFYDSSLMKRFGPRTVTAIEKLAYLLHPYYFANPEKSVSPWELGKIDVAENFPKPLD